MSILLILSKLIKVFLRTFRESHLFLLVVQMLYYVLLLLFVSVLFNVCAYQILYYVLDVIIFFHVMLGLQHVVKDYIFDFKLQKYLLLIINLLLLHILFF